VFYTGKRYERAADFVTDTKRVHYDIPLIGIDDLKKILPLNCVPVAVELVEGARPLPEYTHPDRALYIFGPEDGSLDQRDSRLVRRRGVHPDHRLHEPGRDRQRRALRPHGQGLEHALRAEIPLKRRISDGTS
jgi:hypothetical protein